MHCDVEFEPYVHSPFQKGFPSAPETCSFHNLTHELVAMTDFFRPISFYLFTMCVQEHILQPLACTSKFNNSTICVADGTRVSALGRSSAIDSVVFLVTVVIFVFASFFVSVILSILCCRCKTGFL